MATMTPEPLMRLPRERASQQGEGAAVQVGGRCRQDPLGGFHVGSRPPGATTPRGTPSLPAFSCPCHFTPSSHCLQPFVTDVAPRSDPALAITGLGHTTRRPSRPGHRGPKEALPGAGAGAVTRAQQLGKEPELQARSLRKTPVTLRSGTRHCSRSRVSVPSRPLALADVDRRSLLCFTELGRLPTRTILHKRQFSRNLNTPSAPRGEGPPFYPPPHSAAPPG